MRRLAAALALTLAACTPTPTAVHRWQDAPAEVRAEHSPEVIQDYIDAYWRNVWIETYWRRVLEFTRAVERAQQAPPCTGPGQQRCSVEGIEVCNGTTLPTCGIVWRESRFDPHARNRSSSAWGLYQFLASTWRSVCPEYHHGSASVAQQAECAYRLWANGAGRGHWRLTA